MHKLLPEVELRRMSQALELMRFALTLLDQASAPHDIGAHLDLAVCRLEEVANKAPLAA